MNINQAGGSFQTAEQTLRETSSHDEGERVRVSVRQTGITALWTVARELLFVAKVSEVYFPYWLYSLRSSTPALRYIRVISSFWGVSAPPLWPPSILSEMRSLYTKLCIYKKKTSC